MTTNFPNNEVIQQEHPGSPYSFEMLYTNYVHKVYQHCLSMTKNQLQAEDFTHDIFLKVYSKLDTFKGRSSVCTWLHAITFNYCVEQLRKAKRLTTTSLTDELQEILTEPVETQTKEEWLRVVDKALKMLSLHERTILQMKYEYGMTLEDIALVYMIKTSAVKMRLKRSREKLYRYCQNAD